MSRAGFAVGTPSATETTQLEQLPADEARSVSKRKPQRPAAPGRRVGKAPCSLDCNGCGTGKSQRHSHRHFRRSSNNRLPKCNPRHQPKRGNQPCENGPPQHLALHPSWWPSNTRATRWPCRREAVECRSQPGATCLMIDQELEGRDVGRWDQRLALAHFHHFLTVSTNLTYRELNVRRANRRLHRAAQRPRARAAHVGV